MGPHERKYDMNHILYRISNRLNGRYYIGMHSTKNIGDGYLGSGLRISHEINKYGKENFERIVLEKFSTRKELAAKERELVNEAMLLDPLCLNLKLGGEGGGKFYSVEHQRKCAAAGGKAGGWKSMQIINRDPVVRAKVIKTRQQNGSLATCGMLGKKHSTSAKEQMSASGMQRRRVHHYRISVTLPNGSMRVVGSIIAKGSEDRATGLGVFGSNPVTMEFWSQRELENPS